MLLHLVDIAPTDPSADPVRDAIAIVGELGKFSEDLLAKPRWLVLNKSDLLPPEEAVAKAVSIAVALKYRGPAFLISGATHAGTRDLTEAVMRFIETGEAPAQGNLPLPAIREPKPAKKAAAKKPAAKKTCGEEGAACEKGCREEAGPQEGKPAERRRLAASRKREDGARPHKRKSRR